MLTTAHPFGFVSRETLQSEFDAADAIGALLLNERIFFERESSVMLSKRSNDDFGIRSCPYHDDTLLIYGSKKVKNYL